MIFLQRNAVFALVSGLSVLAALSQNAQSQCPEIVEVPRFLTTNESIRDTFRVVPDEGSRSEEIVVKVVQKNKVTDASPGCVVFNHANSRWERPADALIFPGRGFPKGFRFEFDPSREVNISKGYKLDSKTAYTLGIVNRSEKVEPAFYYAGTYCRDSKEFRCFQGRSKGKDVKQEQFKFDWKVAEVTQADIPLRIRTEGDRKLFFVDEAIEIDVHISNLSDQQLSLRRDSLSGPIAAMRLSQAYFGKASDWSGERDASSVADYDAGEPTNPFYAELAMLTDKGFGVRMLRNEGVKAISIHPRSSILLTVKLTDFYNIQELGDWAHLEWQLEGVHKDGSAWKAAAGLTIYLQWREKAENN
ncbi:hypothetical protein [Stratiformator vulcanicus]|uniref:DUF4861 domain-containing protein n=1 Tax=Stratiformator vulcanicus TaxID=2527980 RepID=A0A517R1G7_9PLAN|nr:hypothetical protein [Stratiformator vulcanicus]QDT37716.1 hypothetical protein Pan189_20980 [Stratiformator vulcanicus]